MDTKQTGYTLLELVVIITIICVLLSIAVLNYADWTVKYGIESQTKKLYADLMAARARAMGRGKDHFVTLAAGHYTVKEDTNENGENDAGDAVVLSNNLERLISWNGSPQIDFNSRGISSAGETIFVPNTVNAACDCVVIAKTRITLGKMRNKKCVHK
ncbi:MAG TPA: GspH/FimT family pseudopilin [Dissulfurispiraceae bacterium]